MENQNPEEILRQMAKEKVHKLKQFYIHLFIYTIGVIFYVAKTYFGVPFNFWPVQFINWFVMAVWTLSIAIQGMQLFVTKNLFGSNWEERKIKELMEKEKKERQKWQ